nr:sigma-70 family RNA polymerase sigma factor [Planctomycetota bacterium]
MSTPGRLNPADLTRHAAGMRALAGRLVQGTEADDVTQDALLRALEKGERPAYAPAAWLRGIVRNVTRERRRSEGRRRVREDAWRREPRDIEVARAAERTEDQLRIAQALNRLPAKYRSVVWLRYFGGHSPAQIAELLGEPPATIRTRLHRAMGLLRSDLDANYEGGREGWKQALAPIAGLAAFGEGAVVASSARWATMATVLLVLGAFGIGLWWLAPWSSTVEEDDTAMEVDAEPDPVDAAALQGTAEETGDEPEPVPAAGTRALRITVVDVDSGKPIPGARVWIARELAPRIHVNTGMPNDLRTGDDGTVDVRVAAEGKLVAKAYADGFLTPSTVVAVSDAAAGSDITEVRLPLSQGDVLEGQVLLPDGTKPTAPVVVKIAQFRSGTSGPAYGTEVTSDATGAFVARGLRRCNLRLTVMHEEHSRRYFGRVTARSDQGHIELTLRAPGPGDRVVFRIRFRDVDDKPVTAARARLIVKDGGHHWRHESDEPMEGEL